MQAELEEFKSQAPKGGMTLPYNNSINWFQIIGTVSFIIHINI